MTAFITFFLLGQVSPGPLDAFRANFASIRADVDYTYEFGRADSRTLDGGRLWKGEIIGFVETRTRAVEGRWSHDGTLERYEGRAPEDALRAGRALRGNGETTPYYNEPFELIFDGERAAYHHIKGESTDGGSDFLNFRRTREPGWLGASGGPFYWWGKSRFPIFVDDEFKDARIDRTESSVNGFRTELEIYAKSKPDFGSLEIHYDPSVGYLPRYMMVCGYIDATRLAVREMYMVNARPCAAGGFVPLEWYAATYHVDNFTQKYPAYDFKTDLKPSSRLISVGHYKAVRLTDRNKPVTLEKLAGITTISTDGGMVALRKVATRMSLDDVESRLRPALKHPRPSLPTVDIDEIRRFAKPPEASRGWYLIAALCLAVPALSVLGFWALRRRGVLVLLMLSFASIHSGCGGSPPTSGPRLAAEVIPSFIVYEPNTRFLSLTVKVTNKSAGVVKLYQASGGCKCRKIDQRSLPIDLKPAQDVALSMTLTDDLSYDPRFFILALSTDLGILELPLKYVALPRHRLSPASINLGTLTDVEREGEHSFELVHREILEKGRPRTAASLQVPPQFSIARIASDEVGSLEDSRIAYVDRSYRLTLKDKNPGLNKSLIKLGGLGDGSLVESSIVWQRVPYLSSTPSKVSLGTRLVRAFLRCPDETVELKRVLSAPAGIKAVVSSPREVTIMPDSAAPALINGIIEVGTTATGHPPLRIPVARYAPLASRDGDSR